MIYKTKKILEEESKMTSRNHQVHSLVKSLIGMIRQLRSCECKCKCGVREALMTSAESSNIVSAHVS